MSKYHEAQRNMAALAVTVAIGMSLSGCVTVNPAPSSVAPVVTPSVSATPPLPPTPSSTATAVTATPPPPKLPPTSSSAKAAKADWPDVIKEARSGVAHLLVSSCEDSGAGSGFLIEDDLIVTAAHVVKNAAEITIRVNNELVSGQILGSNDRSDIAVVRLARDSKGHQFSFIKGEPRIGTEIQALGFPKNLTVKESVPSENGFTANTGSVTALNQVARYDSGPIENMIRIDTSVDSGNSGGPLITQEGQVVGLVSGVRVTEDGSPVNGWGYAVEAPRITAAVDEWKVRGEPVGLKSCDAAPAPEGATVDVTVSSSHDQASNIAQSLLAHGQAINNGNYDAAYEIFTGPIKERVGDVQTWENGIETSYWRVLDIDDVEGTGDTLLVHAMLITAQDPQFSPAGTEGQACSIWDMKYTMKWDGTRWLMANVKSNGTPENCTEAMEEQGGIGD